MAQVEQGVAHFYRQFRQHQRDVQARGGGAVDTYADGRVEVTYAGSPYGQHAATALRFARRQARFFARVRRVA